MPDPVTLRRLTDFGDVRHFLYQESDGTSTPLPDHDCFYEKVKVLTESYGITPPRDFYRFIFQEGSLERLGHYEDRKPNGIILSIAENPDGKNTGRKIILTDGLEQLEDALKLPYVICSPISYYGKSRKASNALYMHAMTLDIDYVGLREITNLIYWAENDIIPKPTFIVNSGHGVHLYYVFEKPIPMFKENQLELRKLKTQLVKQIWTDYTSCNVKAIEVLGVVQGFRMVGSRTKLSDYALTAHQIGNRVTLDYLNGFVMPEHQAAIKEKHGLTLAEARDKYPDWYQRVVVEGQRPGRWHVKRDLYDWYKRKIEVEATYGHRYFCIMCLAVYAAKCDISREELEADALRLQKIFNDIKPDQPFTVKETLKALEAYNEDHVTFPRDYISRVTAIPMPASKRNGRTLDAHIKVVNAMRKFRRDELGEDEYGGSGRPTKEDLVKSYAREHPEANHSQIARALGISRPTVIKWLKDKPAD